MVDGMIDTDKYWWRECGTGSSKSRLFVMILIKLSLSFAESFAFRFAAAVPYLVGKVVALLPLLACWGGMVVACLLACLPLRKNKQ